MVSRSGRTTRLCQLLTQPAKVPHPLKKATNSRHRLTPVTISAFIMGMLFTIISGSRALRRMAWKPMDAKVPATVAMTVASRLTSSVVYTLCIMMRFWNSFAYHIREKPFHTVLLFPALKENTISSTMGAYRKMPVSAMKKRLPNRTSLFFFTASPPVPRLHRSDSSPACR